MRIVTLLTCVFFLGCMNYPASAQELPALPVKTLDGQAVDLRDYLDDARFTIINLWATWCKPCQQELDNLVDLYPQWQEEFGVQILAVNIDTQRQLAKVGPLVNTKGWDYTVLSDVNQQLRTVFNYQAIPQLYVLGQNGEVLYSHSGYVPGNEYELEEKLRELAGK